MKIIYGIEIHQKVFDNISEKDKTNIINDDANLKFVKLTQSHYVFGFIFKEGLYSYHINNEKLNTFVSENKLTQVFNSSIPKILTIWLDTLKAEIDNLKELGMSEEEVKDIVDYLELPEKIDLQWYVIEE